MNDLSQLMNDIKNEITSVVERHLLPHFERMKCNNENIKLIETVLKQMPEFQRLEKENAELKRELEENVNRPRETPQAPAPEVQAAPVPEPVQAAAPAPAAAPLAAPVPEQKLFEHIIKLNIIETTVKNETVSESELYKNVNLSDNLNNAKVEEAEEEEETEEEASEAEEDGVEEAEPLEEEEASEAEEDGVEGAEPLEEEASEAEEEVEVEVEEEEEEEEEAEEEAEEEPTEPLHENTLPSPAVGVEGGDPLEEEVSIVSIKGHGKFYTSNPTNGDIYKIEADEEVGDQVGKFVGGVPIFF